MKKPSMFRSAALTLMVLASMAFFLNSCDKDDDDAHNPPTLVLKTGTGYTSANTTAHVTDSLKVGVSVTKTEDDLISFNVSYSVDTTVTTTTTINNDAISGSPSTYDHDYIVHVALAGAHGYIKYFFTITDHDGNSAQKTVTVVVN